MRAKRIGLLAAVGLVVAGGYVAYTRLTRADRLAANAADPTAVADLLALGEPGFAKLPALLRSADTSAAAAIGPALKTHFRNPSADFPFAERATALLGPFAEYTPAGQAAVLALVPDLMKAEDACRSAVKAGFGASDAEVRTAAVRLAPKLGLTADAAGLVTDASPEVRTAALAVAGASVEEEVLFKLLHDPAEPVRSAAEGVLLAGGRSETDIRLGRRLSAPTPADRLRLVPDLLAGQARDPGPWLERLARDPVPAVRAAAARAAADLSLPFAPWVDQLAADDPDPAVRAVARFHRGRLGGRLTPVGGP